MSTIDHRKDILERIKNHYHDKVSEKSRITLPKAQQFTIFENNVTIHLSEDIVCCNMQVDASAFEGWALVLYHWGSFERVILSWNKPCDILNVHYQRFLFRIANFQKYNASWFSVSSGCVDYANDLKIQEDGIYLLNSPSKARHLQKPLSGYSEALLEYRFVVDDLCLPLKALTGAKFLNRQLPVGVFSEKVARHNEIFTRNKSAIDLWGINDTDDLLIFELKAMENNKIGIVSELFFYVCVVQWLIKGNFKHERSIDPYLALIPKVKRIRAYFLGYDLHHFIDPRKDPTIFYLLNRMQLNKVEYHYIRIGMDDSLHLEY